MTHKYSFIIATAAITRADLHREVIPDVVRFVADERVKWLINIDQIPQGDDVDDTESTLRTLLAGAPNIDLEISRGGEQGCFLSATKNLALRAQELLEDCELGVFWLEDDWQLRFGSRQNAPLERVRLALAGLGRSTAIEVLRGNLGEKARRLRQVEGICETNWFLSLVPRTQVSFNPGIWSKALFERAVIKPLQALPEGTIDDPETLCADPLNRLPSNQRPRYFLIHCFRMQVGCGARRQGL